MFVLECCYLLEGLSDIEYFSALISSPKDRFRFDWGKGNKIGSADKFGP